MPAETQPLRVSPESLKRKHEVSEKRVRNVVIVGAAAWFLLVLALLSGALAIHLLSESRPMQPMTPLGLISAPDLKPLQRFPGPVLQIDDDHAERVELYAKQDVELNSYGWVDRSNGVIRIPIQRAMDLILQRGLLAQTNGNPQPDGPALELNQKIPGQK